MDPDLTTQFDNLEALAATLFDDIRRSRTLVKSALSGKERRVGYGSRGAAAAVRLVAVGKQLDDLRKAYERLHDDVLEVD